MKAKVAFSSSQAKKLSGGSHREHFVSDNRRLCQKCHMHMAWTHLAKPSHHQLPGIGHLLPGLLRVSVQHPGMLLLQNSLFSLSFTLTTHGDISNIHLEAESNKGGIKRICTTQEASTAAHNDQNINTDCSSGDLEMKKKKVLIEPSYSVLTLFLHCLWLMETKHVSICVLNYRLTISV